MSTRRNFSQGATGMARVCAVLLASLLGCSTPPAAFDVIDYRGSGEAKRYHETFDEAYYTVGRNGNVEIVLRRRQPTTENADDEITQVIHLRTAWCSIPGKTVADSTQLNGTVSYLIVGAGLGATFEGAGSIFCSENRRRDALEGSLDLALLRPTRRLAAGQPIFHRARLQGKFHATRDRRRVIRILNEMNRLFGPLPPVGPE